jgi:hypothetical protein
MPNIKEAIILINELGKWWAVPISNQKFSNQMS